MIRAKELGGRAVVDVDAAEKLGSIDRIVIDPESRRVAGFVISRGSSIFNNDKDMVLSASTVHAVGPDAVTVRRGGEAVSDVMFDGLPRVSDITGRKVVSDQGRLLGTVDDVLIDEHDGRIVGYALSGDGLDAKLQQLVSGDRHHERRAPFLRADADLRAGKDLIVAPEDAISDDWESLSTPASASNPDPRAWTAPAQPTAQASPNPWIRSDADGTADGPERI